VFIVLISLILTLGILFGGHNLYMQYAVQKPVLKELYSSGTVKKAEIEKKNKKYIIDVQLNDIDNIQKGYEEVESIINGKYKPDSYELVITGKPNKGLEDLYEQLQPAVYDALANNRYLWLNNEIKKQTDEKGMVSKLFIDERRLYIQVKADDYYFFKIIDRGFEKMNID
ncbi:MAG TPA: hypothetical protein VFC96_03820, partial [Anaerovoracaceae bacterium]|nr:hypothetical protein [Anaerovoracaceae bacterium]